MDDDGLLDPEWSALACCIRVSTRPALRRPHRIGPLRQHAIARQVLATLARRSRKLDVASHTLGLYLALGNVLLSPCHADSHELAEQLNETGGRLAALLRPGEFFANADAEQFPSPILGIDVGVTAAADASPRSGEDLLLPFLLVGWTDAVDDARSIWRSLDSPPGSALFTLLSAELAHCAIERVRGSDRIVA